MKYIFILSRYTLCRHKFRIAKLISELVPSVTFTDGDMDGPTDPLDLKPRLGDMLDAGDPLDVKPPVGGVLRVKEEPRDAVFASSSAAEGMKKN